MTCRSGETKESNALLWTWKGAVVKEKFITGNQKFEVQDFSLAELWRLPLAELFPGKDESLLLATEVVKQNDFVFEIQIRFLLWLVVCTE